jgi:hypothetical protein
MTTNDGGISARSSLQFLSLLFLFALGGGGCLIAQINQRPEENAQTAEDLKAVPNRPTFSTTGETVQRGVFEIEYGMELTRGHQNVNGLLKFGILGNLEVRFANIPVTRDDQVAGFGDSGAGFKFRFLEQRKALPTVSFLYGLTIPTAKEELGSIGIGHSAGLLFSKDLGRHHVDFNESVQWIARPEDQGFDHNYFTAVSYSIAIKEKLGFSEEIAGFSRTSADAATLTVLQALTYSVRPRLVLDAGFYIAAKGVLPRATFFAGVTYSIANLYHANRHPRHPA